jgi:thioredoxin-related protein
MRRRAILGALASFAASAACAKQPDHSAYVVDHYDPARDSAADLATAMTRASAENKRILMIVGGEWCVWCHYLENYLQANDDVRAAFAQSFVILKIDYSREHPNTAFLGQYPRSAGYPDFFVLDAGGALLAQQNTSELEDGRSYHRERMLAFAQRWRPA